MFLKRFCSHLDGMYDCSDEAKNSLWVGTVLFIWWKITMSHRDRKSIPRGDKKKIKYFSVHLLYTVIKRHNAFLCFSHRKCCMYFCVHILSINTSCKVEMAKLSSAGTVNTCVLCSVLKILCLAVKKRNVPVQNKSLTSLFNVAIYHSPVSDAEANLKTHRDQQAGKTHIG